MKIRIQGSNIRFRLKQYEVESFKENGTLVEVINFGPEENDRLQFCLMVHHKPEFSLEQNGTNIQLNIPVAVADDWTRSDKVGFEEAVTTSKGGQINILVEKDFKCKDGTEEDNIGSYPNPRA